MASSRHPSFHDDDCELTVFQRIGVTGEVVITPKIECGPISVTCLEGEIVHCDSDSDFEYHRRRCGGDDKCRILIFQELCVEVPVRFKAKAKCDLTGVHCGPASTDPDACLCHDGSGSDSSSSSDCSGSSGSSSSSSTSGSGSSGSSSSSGSGTESGSSSDSEDC